MFSVIALLVMLEPDMDSTMVLTIIVATVLIAGGIRAQHLVALASAVVVLTAGLAMAAPYRRARMFAYLDPWKDKTNTGYQITQSLIAIGSGGLTGVGLGAGRSKWLFLPNAHTDFIFAVIGEELGLLGCALVVLLFCAFAALGTRAALRAPDRFGMLVAAGITAWVVGQAVINIGAVVGLLPVSGIPLPFVSFGGSALVFTMAAAGILANIARHETPRPVGAHGAGPEGPDPHRHAVRSRVGGSLRGGEPVSHDGLPTSASPRDATAWPRPDAAASSRCSRPGARVATSTRRSRSPTRSSRAVTTPRRSGSWARRGTSRRRSSPRAGFAVDLLPGRGLQRRFTLANLVTLWDALRATVRADRARPPVPARGGRGLRQLRRPADRRRGPAAAPADGGPRPRRRARPRQPHRGAARGAGGHLAADHRAARARPSSATRCGPSCARSSGVPSSSRRWWRSWVGARAPAR